MIDVRKFPFDTQICQLEFGSWSHDGLALDIKSKNRYGDLSPALENVEWNIVSFNASRDEAFFSCCPAPYPSVTFFLELERKSTFYVLNMLFPSILLTLMSILSFLIPSEAGEKVSFSMTLLLALAVFQLMIADSVPPSAETLPIICKHYNFSNGNCADKWVWMLLVIRRVNLSGGGVYRLLISPLKQKTRTDSNKFSLFKFDWFFDLFSPLLFSLFSF